MNSRIQLHRNDHGAVVEERLISAAQVVLDQHPAHSSARMTIVITSVDTMRELNQRHRQIDSVTDVLSFSAPSLPDEIGQPPDYLGDVLIAREYVAAKAEARGVHIEDTLCLLVIHGTLHLLGYEHDTVAACDHMWAAQESALKCLGVSCAIVQKYETSTRT